MSSNFGGRERHNGHGSDGAARVDDSRLDMEGGATNQQPDPIREFRESLKGLGAAVAEFSEARIDGVRIATRDVMLKVVLGIVGAVAGVVFLIVSMVLLLMGLAGGMSRLFNAPPWLGYLIVGALCIGAPATVLIIKVKKLKSQWLQNVRKKYAGRTEIQCEK